jgi:hypothetical protein
VHAYCLYYRPDIGSSKHFWNVCKHLLEKTAQYPRRLSSLHIILYARLWYCHFVGKEWKLRYFKVYIVHVICSRIYLCQVYHNFTKRQWKFTAFPISKALVCDWVSPCGICCGQLGTGTVFSSYSVIPRQYHFTVALHTHVIWACWWPQFIDTHPTSTAGFCILFWSLYKYWEFSRNTHWEIRYTGLPLGLHAIWRAYLRENCLCCLDWKIFFLSTIQYVHC